MRSAVAAGKKKAREAYAPRHQQRWVPEGAAVIFFDMNYTKIL